MRHLDEALDPCPACGGAGGGPFGRPGSAWDTEGYVCPRCHGAGVLGGGAEAVEARPLAKGLAKGIVRRAPAAGDKMAAHDKAEKAEKAHKGDKANAAGKPGPARTRPAARERAGKSASSGRRRGK